MPHPGSRARAWALGGLATAALLVATGNAQTPPASPQQTPVFRGGVELVTVDVTVVDKDGKPVEGLKPEDFVVSLQGQPRPVRALDYQTFGGSTAPAPEAEPAHETTNAAPAGTTASRGGRVILILVDDLSFPPGRGKELTTAALRMLPTFDSGDLVGLATTSGLGPVVNPTRDRDAIKTALTSKGIVGRNDDTAAPFYIGLNEAFDIERDFPRDTLPRVAARECPELSIPVDQCEPVVRAAGRQLAENAYRRAAVQFAAYQAILQAMRNAPKPRIVVALSNGVAVTDAHTDLLSQLEPITEAAAEADVRFYAMTLEPDMIDMSATTQARAQAEREEGRFLTDGIQTIASAAGGDTFVVIGTADRFFKRIELETSGFYRLGVEAPDLKNAQRFLSTKVSVKKSGVTVRVRRQALMASAAPEAEPIDQQLKTRLAQGGVAYGVPIALATALRRDPSGAPLQLGVNVDVPAATAGPLVAMFALVNDAGQIVQAGQRTVPAPPDGGDYRLAFPVPMADGTYRLRFSVADAKGNIGSVERNVKASLTPMGNWLASDLLLTSAGADGDQRFLALETLPESAMTLHATLELYAKEPATSCECQVHFSLTAPGSADAVFDESVTPEAQSAVFTATAEIPVDDLKSGGYVLRAIVRQDGRDLGTVTTLVRKN